jgi:hypothetical protein
VNDRSPINVLFDEFYNTNNFISTFDIDKNGKLKNFLIIYKNSLLLYNQFPTVITIDATYKTNKYKLPLLEIIGFTSTNSSFFICFIFMSNENEINYKWSINQLKNLVFKEKSPKVIITDCELALINAIESELPTATHFLCIWHIQKNIKSKVLKYINDIKLVNEFMEEFNKVVYCNTIEEYNKKVIKFNDYTKTISNELYLYIKSI